MAGNTKGYDDEHKNSVTGISNSGHNVLPTSSRKITMSPSRVGSEESVGGMKRTDSLASLRVLAQLIDGRTGYFEEARMSESALADIKNAGVREFYTQQNEHLDGWREVDEVLESQFPTEVMRRFVVPQHIVAVEGAAGDTHNDRMADDIDDAIITDDEGESLSVHPFSYHAGRRGRGISERAMTSISGMLTKERMAMRGNSCAELAAESLQDLSTSIQLSEANREHKSLADLLERPDMDFSRDDSPYLRFERKSQNKTRRNRSLLRKMLSEHPVMDEHAPSTSHPKLVEQFNYGSVSSTLPSSSSTTKPASMAVWTKADHERDQLLQNVPTHQRKQDSDALVRFYININLLLNLLLVVGKIVAVWSSNSVSLLASLVDSVLDLLCTIVIFVMSRATAYRSWHTFYKYPVGKRRLEPLGVLIFSVLMVVSFLQVLLESVSRLWDMWLGRSSEKDLTLPMVGIVFMVMTIVTKTIMWMLCRSHKNSSMHAIAQDSENDAMFNMISLIFPILGQYLGLGILDPIGGAGLSIYIISEWVSTLADTTDKLTGKVASAQDAGRCLYLVSRFSLVKAISGFEMYHVGDTMVAEVDVVLPMSFKLKEAHDLGEIITYCIESLTGIERAYIHLDYNPSGQSGHIGQRG